MRSCLAQAEPTSAADGPRMEARPAVVLALIVIAVGPPSSPEQPCRGCPPTVLSAGSGSLGWFLAGLVIGAVGAGLAIAAILHRRRLQPEPLAGADRVVNDLPVRAVRHGRAA